MSIREVRPPWSPLGAGPDWFAAERGVRERRFVLIKVVLYNKFVLAFGSSCFIMVNYISLGWTFYRQQKKQYPITRNNG